MPDADEDRKTATFVFHGRLNDFLTAARRNGPVRYQFTGLPAVKDAVEALGVPHTEIGLIDVDGDRARFDHSLDDEQRVAVHPRDMAALDGRFVADIHLGKLARWLRLLGFDTLYRNDYADPEIVDIAVRESRVALTRDLGLLKHARLDAGYWVRAGAPADQVVEVLERFALRGRAAPFSRCLACNAPIRRVDKAEVEARLLPRTRREQHEFRHCPGCDRVYWRGSHFARLQELVERVLSPS